MGSTSDSFQQPPTYPAFKKRRQVWKYRMKGATVICRAQNRERALGIPAELEDDGLGKEREETPGHDSNVRLLTPSNLLRRLPAGVVDLP